MTLTNKFRRTAFYLFVMAEAFLYGTILSAGGDVLVCSSYSAIALCFLFCLLCSKELLLMMGMFFTLLADFCLVIQNPIQRLWGMIFFLGTQCCYALWLHRRNPNKYLLWARVILTVSAAVITKAVLGAKTDALAVVSVCYYANLIMNILSAFFKFREQKILTIGLCLFLLCDTVIGLQVAASTYLPISERSVLYGILFMNFNLSWFFYLPSQILIALTATGTNRKDIFTVTEE